MSHPNAPEQQQQQQQIRKMPHNDEAERAVLGAIFVDDRAFYEVAPQLRPRDFYRQEHRKIWRAMERLVEADEEIDVITLADQLEATNWLSNVGGPSYLTRLSTAVPSAANVDTYVRIMRTKAKRRELISSTGAAQEAAYSGEKDPQEIVGELVTEL